MTSPPVSITAYSLCNAMGMSTAEVLAGLERGVSGLRPCPPEFFRSGVAGVLPGELPALPAALRQRDARITRMMAVSLEALRPAVAKACARWSAERVGVVLGTSTGGIRETELAYRAHSEGGALPEGYSVERIHALDSILEVTRALTGIGGPGYVVSTACSSSAKVLGSAQRMLQTGVCDAVIVGGIDTLCQLTLNGFDGLKLLSPRPCRPFSVEREGINIGEGAALLLVEREGDGPARLLGVGESSDAYHMTSPHPEGLGARLAMERALADAGLSAELVDHVNAHATGTKQNDIAEGAAIAALLGDTPVVATKGYTGHLLGAAGATEVVFSIAAIERGFVPASVGSTPLDPAIPVRVVAQRRRAASRYVLSNSFAFGGSNVSVLIGGPEGGAA